MSNYRYRQLIKISHDSGVLSQEQAVLFENKFTEDQTAEFAFDCLNWYEKISYVCDFVDILVEVLKYEFLVKLFKKWVFSSFSVCFFNVIEKRCCLILQYMDLLMKYIIAFVF